MAHKLIFTSTTESLEDANGEVEIVGEIDRDDYVYAVGRMFRVRNIENGLETDAFADELVLVKVDA